MGGYIEDEYGRKFYCDEHFGVAEVKQIPNAEELLDACKAAVSGITGGSKYPDHFVHEVWDVDGLLGYLVDVINRAEE